MRAGRCIAFYVAVGALTITATIAPLPAQADHRPLPPYIDPGKTVWEKVLPAEDGVWLGSGAQRVAIVVWEDMEILNPAERLYSTLSYWIDNYAQDVADAGFSVVVYKFYGMAEDPDMTPSTPRTTTRTICARSYTSFGTTEAWLA
jgi:hypothetical protein